MEAPGGCLESTRKWPTVELPPLQTWLVDCSVVLVGAPLLVLQLQSYSLAISLGPSAVDKARTRNEDPTCSLAVLAWRLYQLCIGVLIDVDSLELCFSRRTSSGYVSDGNF